MPNRGLQHVTGRKHGQETVTLPPDRPQPRNPRRPPRARQNLSATRKTVYSIVSIVLSLVLLIAAVEVSSNAILRFQGVKSPLFLRPAKETILGQDQFREAYRTLDPHLAFTYGQFSEKLTEVKKRRPWIDGFLVESPIKGKIEYPVILALGGSTTDGVKFPGSWPAQLAELMVRNNIRGTVINGGIGGYTTSQDLFKLIRDGFEFKPDIVIDYGGVNDGWIYGVPRHLMVHPYQENVMKVATGEEESRLLPSTMTLLRRLIPRSVNVDYSLGISSGRTRAQTFKKNMDIMYAASVSQGAKFYGVIQPFSYFRSKHANPNPQSVGRGFIQGVNGLYKDILEIPKERKFVFDATQVLEQSEPGVYQPDGVHLTPAGNKVIAQYMFDLIKPDLEAAIRKPR